MWEEWIAVNKNQQSSRDDGCVANAKPLAHFSAGNIARTRINSGFGQKQFGLYVFGSRYLQHNREGPSTSSGVLSFPVTALRRFAVIVSRSCRDCVELPCE